MIDGTPINGTNKKKNISEVFQSNKRQKESLDLLTTPSSSLLKVSHQTPARNDTTQRRNTGSTISSMVTPLITNSCPNDTHPKFSNSYGMHGYHTSASVKKLNQIINFNDPIYGVIEMDALCMAIIDTKEFQRLHHLKQNGTCDYVFRGGHHTRFEHSLGVAHLAEKIALGLSQSQPNLKITTEDIKCVKVAGLCHDLGHGPFSHVYDGVFLKAAYPNGIKRNDERIIWRHEDGSIRMLKHIIEKHCIDLSLFGLSEIDQLFIEEIIGGVEESKRQGRERNKFYLYDIVNNIRSGLDVDKLDYFQRDARYTNTAIPKVDRFLSLGRVMHAEKLNANDEFYPIMICYPDKLATEAMELFRVRFKMHQEVYTHKTVKKIEFMITDALILADPFVTIRGSKNKDFPDGNYRMSECIFDMEALSNLDDRVLSLIQNSYDPCLKPAQDIFEKIATRNLYEYLGRNPYTLEIPNKAESEIAKEIFDIANKIKNNSNKKSSNISSSISDKISIIPFVETQSLELNENSNGFYDLHEVNTSKMNNNHNRRFNENDDIFIQSQDSRFEETQLTQSQPCSSFKSLHHSYTQEMSHQHQPLSLDDIIVEKMHIHYGMKGKNPVEKMRFFRKDKFESYDNNNDYHNNSNNIIGKYYSEIACQSFLPRSFEEKSIRVFSRNNLKSKILLKAFKLWLKENLLSSNVNKNDESDDNNDENNSDVDKY
eukprot:gene10069-13529_t